MKRLNETKTSGRVPAVSVIVPIYKVEEYIYQCIDSVLSQSFSDYELILVDDGSPDKCGKMCDEYSAFDARIVVIHKPNGGLSDARNAGLCVARGEYVYFLDGDDFVNQNLLKIAVSEIRNNYDLVVFNSYNFYIDRIESASNHLLGCIEINNNSERCTFFLQTLLLSKIGWSTSDRLFKKRIIDNYIISFSDNRKIFLEDLFFSCCYCAYVARISCINDRLFYYRQRPGSIMHTDGLKKNFNRINELGKELLRYYTREHCDSLQEIFPQIYFKIFYNLLTNTLGIQNDGLVIMRKTVLADIEDCDFFLDQMRKVLKQKNTAKIDKKKFMEMKVYAEFFLNGNSANFRIKNKLIHFK